MSSSVSKLNPLFYKLTVLDSVVNNDRQTVDCCLTIGLALYSVYPIWCILHLNRE